MSYIASSPGPSPRGVGGGWLHMNTLMHHMLMHMSIEHTPKVTKYKLNPITYKLNQNLAGLVNMN